MNRDNSSIESPFNFKKIGLCIIEDSINGLRSALDTGAHVIAKTGSVPIENLSVAHRVVMHLDEITDDLINELLYDVL